MTKSNQRGAGRTVLVTGASAGIGKSTVERLLREGYTVYAAARRVENMRDLEDLGAVALKMDVTREEDLVAVVERITAEHGGVDVLVNNAGFGLFGAMEDISLDDARYQFEVNLFGLARLTQLVLPHMREQRAGKIVNVSSVAGKVYTPLGSWYHATKHALEGWSDCLRWELKRFGIDVVIVEPGLIRTEFGGIAFSPIAERSADTPYAEIAGKMTSRMDRSGSHGSPPTVIANAISKALRARRPKTRYIAGQYAHPVLLARTLFTDRMFDWLADRMAG